MLVREQEVAMCRSVHVRLSQAETEQVRSLKGVLIPIYASVALALLAVVALTAAPRPDMPVAVADSAAAER
jgi:hypothetical protein